MLCHGPELAPGGPVPYNKSVGHHDVIIAGGGIIGLTLALELRRRGATVLVVDRGEPGHEASRAAGGMLVDSVMETPTALQALATASAHMYPEFTAELERQSGVSVDLRDAGTILLLSHEQLRLHPDLAVQHPLPSPTDRIEPSLKANGSATAYLSERSVDPRGLATAAYQAAKHANVTFVKDAVTGVDVANGRAQGVTTTAGLFNSAAVVNCAGAWAGQFGPHPFPTRPVKGQMLCLAAPRENLLRHVIRSPQVYLIPRSDGRILAGATVEEAGFDKQTVATTIDRLHAAAALLVPELRHARRLEAWAGLRPGTPDSLPILGATATPGYFVATGHFRDGILLAPITALVMADVITGVRPTHDLTPFSPARFAVGQPVSPI